VRDDDLSRLLAELSGADWPPGLRREDPRCGHLVKALSAQAESLAEAIVELSARPVNDPARSHLAELLRMARDYSHAASEPGVVARPAARQAEDLAEPEANGTVEDELEGMLRRVRLNPVQTQMVLRRLGWDGKGGSTLEEAANVRARGVTRERVRQMEKRVAERVEASRPPLPLTSRALQVCAELAPCSRSQAADSLLQAGLVRTPFDPAGLITAAKLVGQAAPISVFDDLVVRVGEASISVGSVVAAAKRLVAESGVATMSELSDVLVETGTPSVDADRIRQHLDCYRSVWWLDDAEEWFFIPLTRNRVINQMRKIFAVQPAVSVDELREGMWRHHRMGGTAAPRSVVRSLCMKLDWLRVEGDEVTCMTPLDYREELEQIERTLVEVFRDHGPVLSRGEATDLCLERGVKRNSTSIYLSYSPIVERLTTGQYALRGSEVPAGSVNTAISTRRRVLQGHGWTSDGRVWIAYALSQAALDSAVVGLPGALVSELQGSYRLSSAGGGRVVCRGTSMWGFSRFIRRQGAQVGDILRLTFDLQAASCELSLGDESLLEPDLEAPVSAPSERVAVNGADADPPRLAPAEVDTGASNGNGSRAFDEVPLSDIVLQIGTLVIEQGEVQDDELVERYQERFGIDVPKGRERLLHRFAWSALGRNILRQDVENGSWLPGPDQPQPIEQLGSWSVSAIAGRASELLESGQDEDEAFEQLLSEVYQSDKPAPKLVRSVVGKALYGAKTDLL
jgi:hypothetical protein